MLDSLVVQSAAGIVLLHVLLFIVFALVRIPLLYNLRKNFSGGSNLDIDDYIDKSPFSLVFNSFFQSLMVQTGWGALDIIPVSTAAKTLHMVQAGLSFMITTGAITLASASAFAGSSDTATTESMK